MPELLLFCTLRCSHSRLFCALRCGLLLLQLWLLFNHLRSSAFLPFSTGFCHFCIFHTSLLPLFILGCHLFFFINSSAYPYVRFLTFLYWLLSLFYFSHFAVTDFSYFAFTFFSSSIHGRSHTVFYFSYLMKPVGKTSLILLSVVLPSVAL